MRHRRLLIRVVACALGLFVQRAMMDSGAIWPPSGVVVVGIASAEQLDLLGPVWYYQYTFVGPSLEGHRRVLLVRPHDTADQIETAAREQPGQWWLVGNEPNDPHQDDLSPEAYAAFYQRTWRSLRLADPSSRIAPAGIANADWRWADAFRESYKAQYGRYPRVDAWNVHNYTLDPDQDPLDLNEFRGRILAFRDWMKRVGEGHKPLLLSEFGVLSGTAHSGRSQADPADIVPYIHSAIEWLATSGQVQAWAWFATTTLGMSDADLYDHAGQLTEYGVAYRDAIRLNAPPVGGR